MCFGRLAGILEAQDQHLFNQKEKTVRHTSGILLAAMDAMMFPRAVKGTPDLSRDHAGHIARAETKRERKRAYNRRFMKLESQ